jgi:signal peptidase I
MMGDNSPRSKDSRLWSNVRDAKHRHAVPRTALVGKAFFIYWPHGVPFLNDGKGYPDGAAKNSVFNTEPINKLFYHQKPSGKVADDPLYPSKRVPFYPNVERMERTAGIPSPPARPEITPRRQTPHGLTPPGQITPR